MVSFNRGVPLLSRSVIGICLILIFAAEGGYAMQPPPQPLNTNQLKRLIEEADSVVLARIDKVQKTDKTIEATLSIETLLKGKVAHNTIVIKEVYKAVAPIGPVQESKNKSDSGKIIVGSTAGPSTYHGKYEHDMRIIVFLEKNKGTDTYKPLGSGTYDKYLAEFLVEDNGIKTVYFKFAEDVEKYAGCEKKFLTFIRKLIRSGSKERK